MIDNKKTGGITGKHNPTGKKTLGEIIRWYKGRCKFEINQTHLIDPKNTLFVFAWQSRFYDHIIRNEKSLNRIRQYIVDNPAKCLPAVALAKEGKQDRNNMENLWM